MILQKRSMVRNVALLAAFPLLSWAAPAYAQEAMAVRNHAIGYALSDMYWAMYQTENGKAECPNGLNDGPREQFTAQFPASSTPRSLMDTQLARESVIWHPNGAPEPLPFKHAAGKTALGINLDGKIGPNDFTGPDGSTGIDNELWRVIGCVVGFRGPDGDLYHFINNSMVNYGYNRFLIELTDVDSLVNDDHVVVTTYRGLDPLLTDATGNKFMPGGSQRIDQRWGKQFIQRFDGKIVNGVLSTDGADAYIPMTMGFEDVTVVYIRGMKFQLKLTADGGEGFMAGYADVDAFYRQLIQANSTHHLSYGAESAPSLYRELHSLADAYPDPETGKNTAISSAFQVKFTQVFVQHPPVETASGKDRPAEVQTSPRKVTR
jgi:hypothetical protein